MKYQGQGELYSHILAVLNETKCLSRNDIVEALAKRLDLDEDFLNQRYEITKQKIFHNHVQWKLNDLNKSGLIEFVTQGSKRFFAITHKGKSFIEHSNKEVSHYIRETYHKKLKEEREAKQDGTVQTENTEIVFSENDENPLEQLEQSYITIRQQIYDEILETILTKSPAAFERLVSDLLQKMGYGDGEVTQLSRDGGIDAIIKGDMLGFKKVYVQAKRYQKETCIGSPEIQSFVGAILGKEGNADKGVFITTARFSNSAKEFASKLSKPKIVLIDGAQLAKYMYDYELGVQNEKTFSIKKLDNDFWETMDND